MLCLLLIPTNGNVITPVTAQMHIVTQPKPLVLKEFNRDERDRQTRFHSPECTRGLVISCTHYTELREEKIKRCSLLFL